MADIELANQVIFRGRSLSGGITGVEYFVARLDETTVGSDFFDDAGAIEADDVEGEVDVLVVICSAGQLSAIELFR